MTKLFYIIEAALFCSVVFGLGLREYLKTNALVDDEERNREQRQSTEHASDETS